VDRHESSCHYGSEYEDGCFLGCCAVESGRSLLMFQRCFSNHHPDDGQPSSCG
jgi:hypothetical protein